MTVHFIGAGPGAADLLTLRAVGLIESSPVCVYAGTYIDDQILAVVLNEYRGSQAAVPRVGRETGFAIAADRWNTD